LSSNTTIYWLKAFLLRGINSSTVYTLSHFNFSRFSVLLLKLQLAFLLSLTIVRKLLAVLELYTFVLPLALHLPLKG
jgi:hypothetical protein